MLKPSDVSLVFQGPILTPNYNPRQGHYTSNCLAAARKLMPEAEIILSTWEGVNVEGLDYDKLVINKDPGYFRMDTGWTTNINRQIVSTQNGLIQATRPFAAKIRTDTLLTGAGFLNLSRESSERLTQWAIFKERILILEIFTRNPYSAPLLHHPSDIFQFGKTTDLVQLWERCSLVNENSFQRWKKHETKPILTPFSDNIRSNLFCSKYYDDQYIWLQCCQRTHPEARIEYAWQASPEQIMISESLLTANFKVSSCEEVGVCLPERLTKASLSKNCYKSQEWDWVTAVYQSKGNLIQQNIRVWKVFFGIWKHLILATTQRLLVSFLSDCITRQSK